jgi:hypothetical protein
MLFLVVLITLLCVNLNGAHSYEWLDKTSQLEDLSNKIELALKEFTSEISTDHSPKQCFGNEIELLWQNHMLRSQNRILQQRLLNKGVKVH